MMEDDHLLDSGFNHELISDETQTPAILPAEEIDQLILKRRKKKKGFTGHLGFAIASCIFGSSFQMGFNTGVINAPSEVIKAFYSETKLNRTGSYMDSGELTMLWSITVSIFAVGGMVGGFSAGYLANKYGRKGAMMRNNLLVMVAAAFLGFSKLCKSYEMIIIGRLLVGINAGLNSGVAPLYLSEIAPISVRGLAGTLNQFAVVFGVLVAQILGLNKVLGTADHWPIVLAFTLVPAIFQLLALPWCPESPRYLLLHNEDEEASVKALKWFHGSNDVLEELEEIRSEGEATAHSKHVTMADLFRSPELRAPLIISIVINLSQQLSGINAVIYYSTEIFMSADLSEETAQYATVGSAAVNVLMTFVSALIMDRAGRRTLHLIGLGGMWVFSTMLAFSMIYQSDLGWLKYVSIVSVMMYIVFFATGPGSIPWFYVAELFSQGPRSAAVSVSVLVNWLANFSVGLSYPNLENAIGVYSFVPFVFMLALFWLYTGLKVPETKGKTIEEITSIFRKKRLTINSDDDGTDNASHQLIS